MTRFTIALAAILLAACSTGPADVGNPPAIAVVGTPGLGAEGYALQRTSDAYQMRVLEATEQAGIVTAEAKREADEIAAQERSRTLALTAAADVIVMTRESGEATAQAHDATSEAASRAQATSFAAMTTRDAYALIQREQALEEIKQANQTQRTEVKAWALSAIVIAFILALAVVIVAAMPKLFGAVVLIIKARAYEKMTKQIQGGGVIRTANNLLEYDPQAIELPATVVTNGNDYTELESLRVIPVHGQNGIEHLPIVVNDKTARESDIELVKLMLRHGIEWQRQNDGAEDRLPSWQSLKEIDPMWSSTRWQKYKGLLENAGAVVSTPNVGTKTRRAWGYENLQHILDGIDDGRLVLSPETESVS